MNLSAPERHYKHQVNVKEKVSGRFQAAAFLVVALAFFGAAAFLTGGAEVLVTRPDLVLLRTVAFSTMAGAAVCT